MAPVFGLWKLLMIIKTAEFIKSAVNPSQYTEAVLPEIAFVGRSNSGKSSLINALLNRKNLVKTSSNPGCTRLINFFEVNDNLSFVDLPGYGYAKISKDIRNTWGKMIESYLEKRHTLRAVVLIIDIRRGPEEEELGLISWLSERGRPCIPVLTKADKLSGNGKTKQIKAASDILHMDPKDIVVFSSKTRAGRDRLWGIINQLATDASIEMTDVEGGDLHG